MVFLNLALLLLNHTCTLASDSLVLGGGHRSEMGDIRERTEDTGHRTQDMGHRTQDTGHRTQDTGHITSGPVPLWYKHQDIVSSGSIVPEPVY